MIPAHEHGNGNGGLERTFGNGNGHASSDGQGNGTGDCIDAKSLSEPSITDSAYVKWGSVTRVLADRPDRFADLKARVLPMTRDPQPHDVMIARVREIGRHTRIELDSGRKSIFYVGDVLVLAFGWRYATQQFFGEVPPLLPEYHMLSQGGVCGRVISAPDRFSDPTLLEPIGYLASESGSVTNLRRHGVEPRLDAPRIPTIVVVGSSMDSGKTTLAANIIRGLTLAGNVVHAGKLTGTACVKDIFRMEDSGAAEVMDFSLAGFASTAYVTEQELHAASETIISNLAANEPDYLVLEIADGVVQRETQMLLTYLTDQGLVDHFCLAVHDAMAGPTCLNILRENWEIEPRVVSGAATISPLSTDELREMLAVPCLRADELAAPSVVKLFVDDSGSFEPEDRLADKETVIEGRAK